MIPPFRITYFENVSIHSTSDVAEIDPKPYQTLKEATDEATRSMPAINVKYGKQAGYVIVDSAGNVVGLARS